jgi:hypothetical protein
LYDEKTFNKTQHIPTFCEEDTGPFDWVSCSDSHLAIPSADFCSLKDYDWLPGDVTAETPRIYGKAICHLQISNDDRTARCKRLSFAG